MTPGPEDDGVARFLAAVLAGGPAPAPGDRREI